MTPSTDPTGSLRRKWRAFGARLFSRAMEDNLDQIASTLRAFASGEFTLLDLGCGDASNLSRYAPPQASLFGAEWSHPAAAEARAKGVRIARVDLNKRLPWRAERFDAVTSNQVIEHLHDTDLFLQESFRVLRPGGLLIVSTENLSSWHNIAALSLGWQAFSLTNVSRVASAIGNPLGNLRHQEPFEEGWHHLRLFSYRGLAELVSAHGFSEVKVRGSGYFPLPSKTGHLDPRHAAFITASGVRAP